MTAAAATFIPEENMPFAIGPVELVIVLVVALLVLGPKRLPRAARALGEAIVGFKDTLKKVDPRDTCAELGGDQPAAPQACTAASST